MKRLRTLARAEGLSDPERTELLLSHRTPIRELMFARKDLTAEECMKFFADEDRRSVLSRGLAKASPWKLELIVKRTLDLRDEALAHSLLRSPKVTAEQVDRLAALLAELRSKPPELFDYSMRHLTDLMRDVNPQTALWFSRRSGNERALALAVPELSTPALLQVISELEGPSDLYRLRVLVETLLNPVGIVRRVSSGQGDKLRAVVDILENWNLPPANVHSRAIADCLKDFRSLTVGADPPVLIQVEPILSNLPTATRNEIVRVVADPKVRLTGTQVAALACHPKNDATHVFVDGLAENPDGLAQLFGVVNRIRKPVWDALSSEWAPRVTFEQALEANGIEGLAKALAYKRLEVNNPYRCVPLLPEGSLLLWLAPRRWTDEAEQLALKLNITQFEGSKSSGQRLLKRQLGDAAELHELFHRMTDTWFGTIGDLVSTVKAAYH